MCREAGKEGKSEAGPFAGTRREKEVTVIKPRFLTNSHPCPVCLPACILVPGSGRRLGKEGMGCQKEQSSPCGVIRLSRIAKTKKATRRQPHNKP